MQLLILVVALVLMVALQLIVKKTKMGKAMRAVSVDSDAAELMGINVNNTISFTFALGSSLAGAAGVLIGLYYNSIEPLMGMTPGIKPLLLPFLVVSVLSLVQHLVDLLSVFWRHYQLQLVCQVTVMPSFMVS